MKTSLLLRKKRQNTFFAFFTALSIFFAVIICGDISTESVYAIGVSPLFATVLFLLFSLGAFFTAIMLYRAVLKNTKTEKIYLFAAILALLLYCAIFPPITVPDEQAHFYSAYYLSNLVCCPAKQLGANGIVFRQCDYEAFYNSLQAQGATAVSLEKYSSILHNFSILDSSSGYEIYKNLSFVPNAVLAYIPSALGIVFSRILHLGFYPTFYVARLFSLASFILITYYAIKITPVGKPFFFTVALLPMTLHVAASVSYDGLIIAICMLFTAYVLKLIKDDRKLVAKNYILLFLLGWAVAISKFVYLPITVMIMFIPSRNICDKKAKAFFIKLGIVVACCAVFFLMGLSSISRSLNSQSLTVTKEASYTLSWALQNVVSTVKVFLKTFYTCTSSYMQNLIGSSLGWFQINSPMYIWIMFYAVLALSFICGENSSHLTFCNRWWLLAAIVGSCILVLASMFFSWTPRSSDTILGVQGRYFLPLIVPLFAAVKSGIVTVNGRFEKYICSTTVFLNLIFAMNLCGTIILQ